jgi:hypothetical protein
MLDKEKKRFALDQKLEKVKFVVVFHNLPLRGSSTLFRIIRYTLGAGRRVLQDIYN